MSTIVRMHTSRMLTSKDLNQNYTTSDCFNNFRDPTVAQQVRCLCGGMGSIACLAQWVKDPVLLQPWRRSRVQPGFDPWPWERPYAMGGPRKKKKLHTPSLLNTHY